LSRSLASLRSGPRGRVARRHRVVDVDHDARVSRLVRARERHEFLRAVRAAAAGDRDLGAGDVELGTTSAACRVKTDVLGTQQVVAVLQTAGDGDRDGAGVWIRSVRGHFGEVSWARGVLCVGHVMLPPSLGMSW